MTNPQYQIPEELRKEVEQAALDLAEEIVAIVRGAIEGYAEQFAGKPGPAPREEAGVSGATARKRPGRPRTSIAIDPILESKVIGLLERNKAGMRSEQINAALGTRKSETGGIIKKLLESGVISRTGHARGTRYIVQASNG